MTQLASGLTWHTWVPAQDPWAPWRWPAGSVALLDEPGDDDAVALMLAARGPVFVVLSTPAQLHAGAFARRVETLYPSGKQRRGPRWVLRALLVERQSDLAPENMEAVRRQRTAVYLRPAEMLDLRPLLGGIEPMVVLHDADSVARWEMEGWVAACEANPNVQPGVPAWRARYAAARAADPIDLAREVADALPSGNRTRDALAEYAWGGDRRVVAAFLSMLGGVLALVPTDLALRVQAMCMRWRDEEGEPYRLHLPVSR